MPCGRVDYIRLSDFKFEFPERFHVIIVYPYIPFQARVYLGPVRRPSSCQVGPFNSFDGELIDVDNLLH